MRRFYAWFGPGRGYDRPDNGDKLSSPNMWGRQDSSPTGAFRFKHGPGAVMASGGQNHVNFSSENAAIQSLAENTAKGEHHKIKT